MKDFADLLTRLTVAVKLEVGSAASQFLALQLSNGLTLGKSIRHGLTVPLGKHRLVVEAFQVRGAARHVEEDDAFGLGGQRQQGLGGRMFSLEHGTKGEASQSSGGLAEEGAATNVSFERFHDDQFLVMVSCKLRMTRAMEVHAANSAGFTLASAGFSPVFKKAMASFSFSA